MDLCSSQGIDPNLEWQIVAWPCPIIFLPAQWSQHSKTKMSPAMLGTTQQMALCWEPVAMEEAGHPEEQSDCKEIMQNLAGKQLPVWKHRQSSCCQNLWNPMTTQAAMRRDEKCQTRLTRAWQMDHGWRSHAIGQQQYGNRSGTIWHQGLLWIATFFVIPLKSKPQTSCCHMLSPNGHCPSISNSICFFETPWAMSCNLIRQDYAMGKPMRFSFSMCTPWTGPVETWTLLHRNMTINTRNHENYITKWW